MGGRGSVSTLAKEEFDGNPFVRSAYTNGTPFDEVDVDRLFDEAVADGRITFENKRRLGDRNLKNDKFAIVALLNAGRRIVLLMNEKGEGRHVDAKVDDVFYEIKSPTSDAYKKREPEKVVYDNLDSARRQFRGDPRVAGAMTRVVFNGKHTTLSDDEIAAAIETYMKKELANQAVEILQVKKDGTLWPH